MSRYTRECDITLASLQDIGFLGYKDSQFVEDISTDVSHFQKTSNSYRVLLFPPFISYNRLLIHKVVEAHFPDLITFSVGDQHIRRTVVAFVEACYRGEKGIQLLSRPKDTTSKEQRSSKWRNLSCQERVANWVRLRELKNRKREIWNSPKVFDERNPDEHDTDLSEESLKNDKMDRTKLKKQAAAIYVPPSMRSRKGTEAQEEIAENKSSNNTQYVALDKEDIAPSISAANVDVQDEVKKPRGRGRGRKKPEQQVYVPRARRVSKDESHKDEPGGLSQPDRESSPLENDAKVDAEDKEVEMIHTKYSNYRKHMEESQNVSQTSDEPHDFSPQSDPLPIDNCDESAQSNVSSENTNNELSMDSGCNEVKGDQMSDNLTFEFYDPAVIAFMPGPKPPPKEDFIVSDVNTGSHLQSESSDELYHKPNSLKNTNSEISHQSELSRNLSHDGNFTNMTSDCQSLKQDNTIKENKHDVNMPLCPVVDHSKHSAKEKNDEALLGDKSETKQKKSKKKRETSENSTKSKTKTVKKETKSKTKKSKSLLDGEEDVSGKQLQQESGDDKEDSWDALFDDDGDCLDVEESLVADITAHVGKVEIDKPKIDYLSYTPKETDTNFEEFNHIVEIYDFPPDFGSHDIIGAFKDFVSQGFDIKWVDDTHALGVFSSAIATNDALKISHPMLKIRPMSEASKQGLTKAKSCQEFLQPYKARPQTTSMAARRLVAGALGMAPRVSREMREQERSKLKAAKGKRHSDKVLEGFI